jgi:hypothetical protein
VAGSPRGERSLRSGAGGARGGGLGAADSPGGAGDRQAASLAPSACMEPTPGARNAERGAAPRTAAPPTAVDCNPFVGNASVYGDAFGWHVDADPAGLPSSPWTDAFGDYCNG